MLEQTTFYPQSTRDSPPLHGNQPPQATPAESSTHGFSVFSTLVDTLNPLHHIPVLSGFYRHLTGQEIGILPRIASGVLLGGPIGAGAAIIGNLIESTISNDTDQHHSHQPDASSTQLASTLQNTTPLWYLAGSPGAPQTKSNIKNSVPEYQNTPNRAIASISEQKAADSQTQPPDEKTPSHFYHRLNSQTASTIQAIVQTHPHPSTALHTEKQPNHLIETSTPSLKTNTANLQKSTASSRPPSTAAFHTDMTQGLGFYRHM